MSRGHEVKAVQEQWLDAEAAKDQRRKPKKTAEEILRGKQRESLDLSRARIARELAETTSDRRRAQLEAALQHLDGEIAKIR
jgi:hypothetical protein